MPPAVSIVLPTFNRAGFLPGAFDCIAAQAFTDWELVVVDDGSTDDTEAVVRAARADVAGRLRLVRQENAGPAAARNRGVSEALGRFVAFFDSDDLWLPHHLERSAQALEREPEVDWVYGACRVEELGTGRVVRTSTFYRDGRPRPFLALQARRSGDLRVIEDPGALACLLGDGLQNGLQSSVIRRRVFDRHRLPERHRVLEDQLFAVAYLAGGGRLGYFDDVHTVYRVHADNTSAANAAQSLEKQTRVFEQAVVALEDLRQTAALPAAAARALRRRLAREWFWGLGYNCYRPAGRVPDALAAYRRGLGYWPWDVRCWKTYLLAVARAAVSAAR